MGNATRSCGVPPPLPVERRAEARTACHIPVVVKTGGHSIGGVLWNVSLSGALLVCAEPLAEGQRIRICITVPTLFDSLDIGAEVRWVLRGPTGDVVGAGVRFDAMRAREMHTWVRYVRSFA